MAQLGVLPACSKKDDAEGDRSSASAAASASADASDRIVVPRLWTDEALQDWATPLAGLNEPPGHYSEKVYYAAPVDNLRTYPLYHPNREPEGYREWMLSQGPQPLIEPEKLKTKDDWIAAGKAVFEQLDTEATRSNEPAVLAHFTSAESIDKYRDEHHDAMTKDGVLPEYRWVVDSDGELKVSLSSCAGCHTRIMPDGSTLLGAPSNFDVAFSPATKILLDKFWPDEGYSEGDKLYQLYGVPWVDDDVHARFRQESDEYIREFQAVDTGAPPGTTFDRFNGSPLYTTRMADLIGVKDRRYLDATGTHVNRGPEDIARYGIMVEFADSGEFGGYRFLPEANQRLRVRPPDAAMYALGLFVYSLTPPPSPHPFDEAAKRGKEIFELEGCVECHTPPVYTNNQLVAVPGFYPRMNDPATKRLAISERRVDTDPKLALRTRKGTGYYKIPSLRGLWYRGLYGHSGSVNSLEDWFDPRRLKPAYRPTGVRGPRVHRRAVPGHEFGLDLSKADKAALIAFLKTL